MKGLKMLRKKYRMSMRELGQILGITIRTVYNYEAGRTSPSIKMLRKMADALNCSINDLW